VFSVIPDGSRERADPGSSTPGRVRYGWAEAYWIPALAANAARPDDNGAPRWVSRPLDPTYATRTFL